MCAVKCGMRPKVIEREWSAPCARARVRACSPKAVGPMMMPAMTSLITRG